MPENGRQIRSRSEAHSWGTMANILVIHAHIPLRASLLDYIRLSGHTGFEAADFHQARFRSRSAGYALIVLGVGEDEPSESKMGEIRSAWPMAEVAVFRNTTDLADVFNAIRHCGYRSQADVETDTAMSVPRDDSMPLRESDKNRGRLLHELPADPIAVDPVTRALFAKADRVAAVNSSVLITGATGTGKEVLARRIHCHSAQRGGKFVPVNCACLPETLIETELFGYKKGAFTGAISNSKGLIEEAERGVLFLDEIGDMPLSMQVRLLRFLDSGEVRAVGDTYVKHADVRVIAATNQNLRAAIRQKSFRDDLFFRLSVVWLELPPLRERRGDIPALVNYHVCRAAMKLGLTVPKISKEALALLIHHHWPGNIRELQNTIEQALVQKSGEIITPDDLPPAVRYEMDAPLKVHEVDDVLTGAGLMIALRRNNGNHTQTATELGISRTTLWRRLRHLKVPMTADSVNLLASDRASEIP